MAVKLTNFLSAVRQYIQAQRIEQVHWRQIIGSHTHTHPHAHAHAHAHTHNVYVFTHIMCVNTKGNRPDLYN